MRGLRSGVRKRREKKMYNDPVNHPAHYTSGSVECIDAMVSAFGAAQVAVYAKIALWRADHKGGTEDMEKARWYINKYLDLLSGGDDHDTV